MGRAKFKNSVETTGENIDVSRCGSSQTKRKSKGTEGKKNAQKKRKE